MSATEPIFGPPPTPPPAALLEAKSLAVALEAAARAAAPRRERAHAGAERAEAPPVERRAFPAKPPLVAWNPVHLRLIREQPIAVYDALGEIEITLDAEGKLAAYDDPRHAPDKNEVHLSEGQAVERVAFLMGVAPKDLDLEAEPMRTRAGGAFLRVRNRAKREVEDKGKFFRKQEEEPAGPPPDRIEADLNGATGRIYRFRRSPAPPPEPPKEAEA